jgi:penicillin G amidase
MRRVLGALAAAILAIALGGAGITAWLAYASLPTLDGELELAGLTAPVTVSRDALGVPLIEADNALDAAMALGFVHAQDRLWQMEMSRRIGAGRLAEVVGEPGLATDRFLRTLGLYRAAEAALDHLSPEALAELEAYAAGVNALILDRRQTLPPEFLVLRHRPEPWRPADSLVLIKTMALSLVESWRHELTRASLLAHVPEEALADLWPPTRPDEVTTLASGHAAIDRAAAPGGPTSTAAAASIAPTAGALLASLPTLAPTGQGSNIWAIAGTHTASGSALLANDPHLNLGTPAHWYLAAIRTPSGLVQGATLPALPVVVIGRNTDIAWGFTNTAGDTEDLFVERLDPADPSRYLTPAGSTPFAIREEVIAVNGQDPVVQVVRSTRNGPVISDLLPNAAAVAGSGHVLALRWTALEPEDSTLEAGMELARATDWDAFSAAIHRFTNPTQNAFYADRDGHIGVRLAGRLPLRRAGDGSLPAPGWTGSHDWQGLLPTAANPAGRNPPSGYLQNANNRLVGDDFPHLITRDWNDDMRARRIDAVLQAAIAAGEPLDLEAMQDLQRDRLSMMASDFHPLLLAVEADDARGAEILAAMAAWNGASTAERPEPLVLQAWYRALVRHVLADELGPGFAAYQGIRTDAMRHILTHAPEWCNDVRTTERVETCTEMATLAFDTALAELEAEHGSDWRRWRWGEASRVHMAHRPLDAIWGLRRLFSLGAPGGGDAGTVDVARYAASDPYTTVMAASLRIVADLAEPAILHAILPAGQSGHPLSPHFSDQTAAWREGRLHRIGIAEDVREVRHILALRPALLD